MLHTTQPRTAQLCTAQPRTAQPRMAQPRTAQPRTTQPRATQPRTAQPCTAQQRMAQQRMAQPRTAPPNTAQPSMGEVGVKEGDADEGQGAGTEGRGATAEHLAMIRMIQLIRPGSKSGCQLARRQNPKEDMIRALKAHQLHRLAWSSSQCRPCISLLPCSMYQQLITGWLPDRRAQQHAEDASLASFPGRHHRLPGPMASQAPLRGRLRGLGPLRALQIS